jgi:uncharacterized membrane protein YkvA (DUF1232 family)
MRQREYQDVFCQPSRKRSRIPSEIRTTFIEDIKRKEIMTDNIDNYSEDSFWEKLKNFAIKAGIEVVEKALQLYYAAQEPGTPVWAKTTIYSALGYFIMPLDVIPDVIPGGFTDDLGILVAAIGAVSMYINDDIKKKAAQKMKDWFG